MLRWLGRSTNAGIQVDEYAAQTLSAVWACVRLKSDSVAQLPVGLFRKEGAVNTPVTDHPVARLLAEGFNPDQSTQMGLYTGQSQIELTGNTYLRILRDERGAPTALYFLPPDATDVILAENTPYDLVEKYRVTYRGQQYEYDPSDVAHIRGHATRGVVGLSPVTAAREAVGLGLAAEKYGATFFQNDGRSGGFFMQPADTSARAKRAKQENAASEALSGQGGPDRAHMPKVLDPGVKYIPVTLSQHDSQYLETRGFTVHEICRFWGVPAVFIDPAATTAWGSGIEQLKIGFVELAIQPQSLRWAGELTRKLLTPAERNAGLHVAMNSGVLLRGDMMARGTYIDIRVKNGTLTRNEARSMEGDNPLPGGDVPLIPGNLQDGTKPPQPQQNNRTEPNAKDQDAD
jgi:HK97 family phage portal protein